jgi:hypothetical protein
MKFLCITALICVFFAVSYAQKAGTIHNIGKDRDGDTWHLDTSLVRQGENNLSWLRIMPIYTRVNGAVLVFIYNVDCSDSTYQLSKSMLLRSGEIVSQESHQSAWANFFGYSGNAARIVCKPAAKRPAGTNTRLPELPALPIS